MQRKVIRLTTIVGTDGDEILIALCEDSTMWSYEQNDDGDPQWKRLPDIPPELDPQQQRDLMVDAPERQPE